MRMAEQEPSPFELCVLMSKLATPEQLAQAKEDARLTFADDAKQIEYGATERALAERLIEMRLINAWQAQQLLDGRTKFNLGPYWIIDSLGQGGMGQVFKAEHRTTKRIAAVKVLPRYKSTPEAIANFTREIRHLASMDHPNLVAALDAGLDGKVYYLVTEFVPGSDLRKLVRRCGQLKMTVAANIISQAAAGLEYAHKCGIVHRDVKPGNLLVSFDGSTKISDLGLAGPLNSTAENDPRHGKIVGTADYISPDQVLNPHKPAPAWDIYALGCTMYYAVTGKVPFPGGTPGEKAKAHCEKYPIDPRRLNANVTSEFVEVMADMMAKEPQERIPSAAAVIERLAPWLPEGPLADSPDASVGITEKDEEAPTMLSLRPRPPTDAQDRNRNASLAETLADFPDLPRAKDGADEDGDSDRPIVVPDLLVDLDKSCYDSGECPTIHPPQNWQKAIRPYLYFFLPPLIILLVIIIVVEIASMLFGI